MTTMPDVGGITRVLATRGPAAAAELLPLVYDELRRMASGAMRHERSDHTLQSTALVHEAWLRLARDGGATWENRGHFFASAAETMRRVLVEHARARTRVKRGGPGRRRVSLTAAERLVEEDSPTFLRLEAAFARLCDAAPEVAEVARLRLFAGLGVPETGEALGLSPATVKRRWTYAKAWLRREVANGAAS